MTKPANLKNIRPLVFLIPISILTAAVAASLIDLQAFLATTSAINRWIVDTFSGAFAAGTLFFVLTCLWAFLSPLGRVRIGGEQARPILSRWHWFSITLCTTVAIGILFWATAEPMFHLYQPGGRAIEPGSDKAAHFAMVSLFMHWSFTPYAIYAVPGLTFALAYYNLNKPFSLAGPLSILLHRPIEGWAADLLDAVALVTLVSGIAASLGTGMLSLSGGIGNLAGINTTPLLLALVAITIVATFVISSLSGLQRGIRILSDINTKFFFLLAAFVLLAGPTVELIGAGAAAFGGYLTEFISRSLLTGSADERQWANTWTVFYWANWLAWAPLTALFLGRIARGYTVREYIAVNFFAPALFSVLWMSIFGGVALQIDMREGGVLKAVLEQSGPEAVLYAVLERFPLSGLLAVALLFLSFISYVTAADSNTEAIASVCQRDRGDNTPGNHTMVIKLIWAGLIGATAWVMTAFSGIDGIRMMSNLGGLPALLLVTGLNLTLLLLGTKYLSRLRSANQVMEP